ncbi:MAG: hypothetical protein ACQESB_07215, partial [Elusimicrobiota bacterium]
DGFTLRENELQVSEGYDHEILGEIKIYHKKYSPGVLSWIFSIPTFGVSILAMQNRMFGSYDRNLLINDLKKKSFEKGGNAVIYALTNVTGDGKFKMNTTAPLARGWSVKVAD